MSSDAPPRRSTLWAAATSSSPRTSRTPRTRHASKRKLDVAVVPTLDPESQCAPPCNATVDLNGGIFVAQQLLAACELLQLEDATTALAFYYYGKWTDARPIAASSLPSVLAACVLIAAKFNESKRLVVDDLKLHDAFKHLSKESIFLAELEVLDHIEWRVACVVMSPALACDYWRQYAASASATTAS